MERKADKVFYRGLENVYSIRYFSLMLTSFPRISEALFFVYCFSLLFPPILPSIDPNTFY